MIKNFIAWLVVGILAALVFAAVSALAVFSAGVGWEFYKALFW